ncbi:MAG: ATP-binding protein [Saprospiraceae bacterium]
MLIKRTLQPLLEQVFHEQKIALLLGARRTGKTELLRAIYEPQKGRALWLNGEDMDTAGLLENRSEANYRRVLTGKTLLIIDEAQYIPDIARKAKLMIDTISPLHIILTGSSAFDLVQIGEPLVGRTITFQLFPLSYTEWKQQEDALQTRQRLEEKLVYGNYPELSNLPSLGQKESYLKDLVSTYLLRDILAFENIRNAQKLKDLLVLLARQVGAEVSQDELGRQLSMSKNTVERYLDLLSKVFVIFPRSGFSANLRKEVVKSKRWYFCDNGIRNALLNDFSPLALRPDKGMLWEQHFVVERMKHNHYLGNPPESYFWRTYDQQEIDLVEVQNRQITAFECKWKEAPAKAPIAFTKAYPDAAFFVAHPGNYEDWVGGIV